MPSNLLCSHLPLQAPNAPLCLLHLPRSRQTRCLQLRKLLLQGCPPHAGLPLLLGGGGSLVGELLLQAGHLPLQLPFQLHRERQVCSEARSRAGLTLLLQSALVVTVHELKRP